MLEIIKYENLKDELKKVKIAVGGMYEVNCRALEAFTVDTTKYYKPGLKIFTKTFVKKEIFILLDVFEINVVCVENSEKYSKACTSPHYDCGFISNTIELKVLTENQIFYIPQDFDTEGERKEIIRSFSRLFKKI